MPNSFLAFLESMTIAMEADDITTQTASDVRTAIGGTPSTQSEPDASVREEEEDIGKVDDIFGTETPDEPELTEPTEEPAPEDEGLEENPEGEDIPTDGEEDPNVSDDANPLEDESSVDDNSAGDPDLVFTKKYRIRDNLTQLYTIISGNIEILANSLTGINDDKIINTMNIVLSHLRNCKRYIYITLTKDLKSLDYDELLQRYITLKRVYDICIQMMQTQFDIINKK